MIRIYVIIMLQLFFCKIYGQQDGIAQLHKPYENALHMLKKFESSMPHDSTVVRQEWQRLRADYMQVTDSLQNHGKSNLAMYLNAQWLIDVINYRTNDEQLDSKLNALYSFVGKHQNHLIKDDAQLKKIALCLMDVRPEKETNETAIIEYNADVIKDLYTHLDTSNWTKNDHQRFITFFASAYLNIGSVRKAQKLFRHFDTFFEKPLSNKKGLNRFSLPNELLLLNGNMLSTNRGWSALQKNRVVIQLKGQSQFDFVYLVSLLRTIHRNYPEKYDVVLMRNSNTSHGAYLSLVKRNLAFSDYYLATISNDTLSIDKSLPGVMIVNANNQVIYQANHPYSLFKKLNAPIEAKSESNTAKFMVELNQKKDSLAALAIKTKDSIRYKATHQNINFVLKGLWSEGLTTSLSPIQWSERDTLSNNNYPYMAQFKVMYSQTPIYTLLVLVTGENQEISITKGFPYKKDVHYTKPKNAKFHEAIQVINESSSHVANYQYIIENYPFQDTAFLNKMHGALEQAKKKKMQAIKSVPRAEEILHRYVNYLSSM